MTTGRLHYIGQMLAPYVIDLGNTGATQAERDIAQVLSAVQAAIILDATADLAQAVDSWWQERAPDAVRALLAERQGQGNG